MLSRRRPMWPWRMPPHHRVPGICPRSAVVAAGYDEEAILQQALEASKADEDKIFPG
jgi:hypothetical protein